MYVSAVVSQKMTFAQLQVVPEESNRGHALFSATTFSGEWVSCTRSGLEKISETRYKTTCSQIIQCQQQARRHVQTEAIAQQENVSTETQNDKRPPDEK